MNAQEYLDALHQAQTACALLFALLLILSAYILTLPETRLDPMCPQHRKPVSQCKDEHRP